MLLAGIVFFSVVVSSNGFAFQDCKFLDLTQKVNNRDVQLYTLALLENATGQWPPDVPTQIISPALVGDGPNPATTMLDSLIGPAKVVAIEARGNPHYQITMDDIDHWRRENDLDASKYFVKDDTVAFNTNWDANYGDSNAYLHNESYSNGSHSTSYPTLSMEVADDLVRRRVQNVIVDTPSVDLIPAGPIEETVLYKLLNRGINVFVNAQNLIRLPATGAYIMPLPVNLNNGSITLVRLIAFGLNGEKDVCSGAFRPTRECPEPPKSLMDRIPKAGIALVFVFPVLGFLCWLWPKYKQWKQSNF